MKRTLAVIVIIPLLLLATAFGLDHVSQTIAQREHVKLMELLLPGSTDFERVPYEEEEDSAIRSIHQSDVGFVIETVTYGYADEIIMQIGVNNAGKVTGLVVYEAHETPGLGNRILTNHRFLAQFLNKSGNFTVATSGADAFSGATDTVESTEEGIAVDGISGATVSSKAVARSVSAAVAYVTGADIDSSATTWGG